jgi:acyl-CoA synthetase (AMP-forming)/AMP-acid ligase II
METIYQAFAATARRRPDASFLIVPEEDRTGPEAPLVELSYGAALHQADEIAERYRAAGYGGGHRIAVMLENRPEFLLHLLALNALGAGIVPLNPEWRSIELGHVLRHSEAALVTTFPRHAQLLRAVTAARPELPVLALGDDVSIVAAPNPPRTPAAAGRAEAALVYTSGTTGEPKGCMLDNDYFLGVGHSYLDEGGLCTVEADRERLMTPLPLFHVNALAVSLMAMILSGGCIIQLDRFHPARWWSDVTRFDPTIIHYLGIMPAMLLNLPEQPDERSHRIRFGFGANADPKHHAAFETRFGFPLIESWGMTETVGGATITASREPRHVGTRCVGTPRPEVEIRLVDDADRDVAAGAPGELLVRRAGSEPRAGFFSAYLKEPEATEAAWRGGWFHTGDMLRRGPDSQFHFVERKKNIIRRAGENIAALEIEAVLLQHPAVRQVAVVGAPDPLRDEEVAAYVVLDPRLSGSRDLAVELQDWCFERLAYFKAPGYLAFLAALPTTATNKVRKLSLPELDALPEQFDLRDRKKRSAAAARRP